MALHNMFPPRFEELVIWGNGQVQEGVIGNYPSPLTPASSIGYGWEEKVESLANQVGEPKGVAACHVHDSCSG